MAALAAPAVPELKLPLAPGLPTSPILMLDSVRSTMSSPALAELIVITSPPLTATSPVVATRLSAGLLPRPTMPAESITTSRPAVTSPVCTPSSAPRVCRRTSPPAPLARVRPKIEKAPVWPGRVAITSMSEPSVRLS